jgi:carbon-monoxide dehydrogenase medium subunit
MKPAPFAYHAPREIDELAELVLRHAEDGRVLAGGQSLVPQLNVRTVRAAHLIDLNGVTTLDRLQVDDDVVEIGALCRQARVGSDEELRRVMPILGEALDTVASPTVRNRGTVCGSLAHAATGSQLPAVVTALGGEAIVRRGAKARMVPIGAFFAPGGGTVLRPGDVLTAVRLTRWPSSTGSAYAHVARMRWPVAGAAALLTRSGDRIERLSLVVNGLAREPIRAQAAEQSLLGTSPTTEAVARAAELASRATESFGDDRAGAAYRSRVVQSSVRRALTTAYARAEEKP